ncbi:DUF5916 domain-containing protein [Niabella soli]|uniref:DUF5916 domain-containing protein n=1 Tax=Niabella soli TaxID=446683 RepID=UPI001FE1E2E8|nr:DUF5916 domain-containing protein [Niabella soli]
MAISSYAQKKNSNYTLHLHRSSSPITIDGVMDEEGWKQADVAGNFFMVLPMDTSHANVRTEVRMTYDNENLYLMATCYHDGHKYMVESLRRDFSFLKNDNFLLFMDPFDDQTNGFSFGANAAGAQWDGTMYEGGKVDLSWDNKWTSVVKNYPDKWVFEAAIPFKSIRYKKGITEWGINFSRLDITAAEKSSWAPVPRQFPTASLAYTGTLVWDEPPPTAGSNVSIIPYALGGISKNYEKKQPTEYKKNIGGDVKIAVTSSLNLDLTVNPDFSQTDVDQQIVNLDRYELFFPEKRQFFLENADLFANFGYANIRPFFSRRIGLNAPIRFGARLSGKLNKDWRIGFMDMQTGSVAETGLPAQNFGVIALQRRVFARSNIGFIFVNKQSLNYTPGADSSKPVYSLYNRNAGLEYNLASANNQWTGKLLFLKSFNDGPNKKDWVHAANLQYLTRKWLLLWQQEYVGNNYNAEVGYVPRRSYFRMYPQAGYLFFPKAGKFISHGPKVIASAYFNESMHRTDDEYTFQYNFNFRDQSTADILVAHDFVQLLTPFDPTNSGKDSLAKGSQHNWVVYGADYFSRPQQLFTYSLSARFGGYYANGKRTTISGELGYRFQPYVGINIKASYNKLDMPAPWNQTYFWLIGPRIDVTMTNKIFFTAFMQYNQQTKNINLNTRFQWRYRPASDFFLVYSDNYLPEPFSVRNRAVVLKFNYWWNL